MSDRALEKDNTFLRIADLERAQHLMEEQLKTWPAEPGKILSQAHPLHRQICRPLGLKYYWSASDTEYATDVIFKDASSLAALYREEMIGQTDRFTESVHGFLTAHPGP